MLRKLKSQMKKTFRNQSLLHATTNYIFAAAFSKRKF